MILVDAGVENRDRLSRAGPTAAPGTWRAHQLLVTAALSLFHVYRPVSAGLAVSVWIVVFAVTAGLGWAAYRARAKPLSAAAFGWFACLFALVLPGLGHDGLAGAKAIVAAGGHVLAQDEATSVVWGMPGQVAHAGLASAVLPLPEIGPKLVRLFGGERV